MPSKKTDTRAASKAEKTPSTILKDNENARRFAASLRQIIDRNALLIMRELSMGVCKFQDIEAQTKIGAPSLASRLRRLEKDGIVGKRLYRDHPPRYEYFATAKGKDLDAVLFEAGNWNVKWGDLAAPSLVVYDKITGKRLTAYPQKISGDA